MSKASIDEAAACVHLAEQFAKVLPGLMKYRRNNRGLDYSFTTDEQPYRVIITWRYKKRRPDNRWQGNIFAKVDQLLDGVNLFIYPNTEGPKGDYVLELRMDNYDEFMIRIDPDDVVIPKYNDLTQSR